MDFYLFGASGHGKVVMEIAENMGVEISGFIDANPEIESVYHYKVYQTLPESADFVVTIGDNRIRKRIAEQYSDRVFPVLVHPRSNISKYAHLGAGTVVMSGVSVNVGVEIGRHCIINTNASVDHDCRLADYVHVSPNVALAGDVHIGEGSHIGIGASIKQGIRVGSWCTVGAGAVVIRDIPDGAVVVGNPARSIRGKLQNY